MNIGDRIIIVKQNGRCVKGFTGKIIALNRLYFFNIEIEIDQPYNGHISFSCPRNLGSNLVTSRS